MIYYNPLDKKCKSITGGIRQNETAVIKVFGESSEPCLFVLQKDGSEARNFDMQPTSYGWRFDLTLEEPGLYFYYFRIGNRNAGLGELRELTFSDPVRAYQLTVCSAEYRTPDWFKGGVMYQIFPDRFYKNGDIPVGEGKILHKNWTDTPNFRMNSRGKVLNNDFFGGNLNGIREKLPYLQQLGVSVVYLNPIFQAFSNHRYDTGDFKKIDPLLGTLEDFDALVRDAAAHGIRIILDGVFNHTGDDSLYFNKYGRYPSIGAYQSKESPYAEWYRFIHFPDRYECWWGIDILPAVNELSSYDEFITGENGVLEYWMRRGLGGFRLDVADELPPRFLRNVRRAIKSADPNGIVIGEVWEDASNKISYGERRAYFQGQELDSVMNYPLKEAIIQFVRSKNTKLFRETVCMLLDHYPKCSLDCLMNILGTHDTVRILTALGGVLAFDKEEMNELRLTREQYAIAVERLKAAALLQFTLFGVPSIYYGDETGTEGYSDPFCRKCLDWEHIDEELHAHYARLGKIRGAYGVFREGEYKEVFADEHCVVFERRDEREVVCVCVNLGGGRYGLNFSGDMYDLMNEKAPMRAAQIEPNSWAVYGNIDIR